MDIDKIKRKLLIKYPLFGSIIANINYLENRDCKTLETDGINIYYNSKYLDTLKEDEQTFMFAHEVCHIAFDHIERSKEKDVQIWNIATDAVINAFLEKDGFELVSGSISIPNAINYNAEQLYKKMLEQKMININIKNKLSLPNKKAGKEKTESVEKKKKDTSINDENTIEKIKNKKIENKEKYEENENEGKREYEENIDNEESEGNLEDSIKQKLEELGHDMHSMWNKNIDTENSEDKKDDTNGEKDNKKISDEIDYEYKGNIKQEDIREAIKEISESEEINVFVANSKQREENLNKIKEDILKKSLALEKISTSVKRNIDYLEFKRKKILDWKYLLREEIKEKIDWSYKNASIENGIVIPHLEELEKPEVEILLDTSGSINDIVLRNFLIECKNILKNAKIKVGCFDTKFYGFKELKTIKDIEEFEFVGHGGTNFYTATKSFSKQVENKIIFTDGRGLIPNEKTNIIWIVFGDEKINLNKGRVIYINNEQLRNLYIA